MSFLLKNSISQPVDLDETVFDSGASRMHIGLSSSAPSTEVYYSPTGEIAFAPPSVAENVFIFGDPMFHSDFHLDVTNELSYFNFCSPSLDPTVTESVGPSVSNSASLTPTHLGGTDEDAEHDLDPAYGSQNGGACDPMEFRFKTEDASTATLFSQPPPSPEFHDDWSSSTSNSDRCTSVGHENADCHPTVEVSSDTSCSDGHDSDYKDPATGTRKRARTANAAQPKKKGGKRSNFKKSSERWPFHNRPVRVRCLVPTCDAELGSINSVIDHCDEEHPVIEKKPDAVRCAYFDCKERAKSVGDMRRHFLKMTHEPHHFKCEACQRMFTRRDPLLRHMRNLKGRCRSRMLKNDPVRNRKLKA
ncbi:uncharacterized protein BT62DRAFT_926680 [Guyanagaster necrorhizus]|uniref:C2H2-type domain-containing protein n=1 Tax=Guyanagaster necrorhizus TaxID=856835 RepID=A0A9P8AXA9_9AGAR|nr:uncharacterized protein BT62DRAFT_926680 [Guyanagaster necrorhizus MCA 3950]KAG7451026.1 hypothetical protein BT62DRAFT_926680 [Guyanagaster necrorhizus MCA 3950]